jgi:hypothetical protein
MFSAITEDGVNFIKFICIKGMKPDRNGNTLLSGIKTEGLPYTGPPQIKKRWECNIMYNGARITTGEVLAEALVVWFNKYAAQYQLDANVIAAQAYAESHYIMWNYAGGDSTASGVSQFTMLTIFGIIIDNAGNSDKMTSEEIGKITNGLPFPNGKNSYMVKSDTYQNAWANREQLHQNVINNPDVMIKAQCRYMKNIANSCDSLTSSTLFCYSRGPAYARDTYSKSMQACIDGTKSKPTYIDEGLTYVLRIFGILGDKDNYLESKGAGAYKPKGYYFGYDEKLYPDVNNAPNPKNLRMKEGVVFNAFKANVTESDNYNLDKSYGTDSVVETLSKNINYKFIYYPEQDYKHEVTNKTQIVLHHTVSGDNIAGDILWWENQVAKTGDKVGTAFIVGRRGEIFQLFSTDYWAYHLGISEKIIADNQLSGSANRILNEGSVGIEIDSWGGLIQSGGNWYPATSDDYHKQQYVANTKVKPIENVIEYNSSNGYPNGFHGFYGFEKYTNDQILAVKEIIQAVRNKFSNPTTKTSSIPGTYNSDMWGIDNGGVWKPIQAALDGKAGIWTHVSYRYDKSDCHPQPELINMLKTL